MKNNNSFDSNNVTIIEQNKSYLLTSSNQFRQQKNFTPNQKKNTYLEVIQSPDFD